MDKSVAHKLFDQTKDRLVEHQGGYTRILKTGHRSGDNAPLAIIQLLLTHEEKKTRKSTGKKDIKGEKKITEKVLDKKDTSKGKKKVSEDEKEKGEKP